MDRIVYLFLLAYITVGATYNQFCDSDPPMVYPPNTKFATSNPQCYHDTFHNLVTFGDSWSDNGKGPIAKDVYDSVPVSEDLDGTGPFLGRQTNGLVWVEYLAALMGANLYGFAYSGATANNTIAPRSAPDVFQQMKLFQASDTNLDGANTAYFIWTGVNDIYSIYYNEAVSGQLEKLQMVEQTIESVEYETRFAISTFNAQHVFVLGAAPIYHLPLYVNETDTTNLKTLITAYNLGLKAVASSQQVTFIDTIPFFERYLANEDNSFADTTHFCYNLDSQVQRLQVQCGDSHFNYLWWDNWHPSTKAHGIFATDLANFFHA